MDRTAVVRRREIFCPAGIESAERFLPKPMKKLLDHFWRKRPAASAPPESQPALPAAATPDTPTKLVRPIATISVAPRTVRPAWQAATGPAPGKRLALQPERPEAAETLTLTLGDFWDRLPSDLLASDAPDRSTPLPFDLAGLSERIGRGDPGIPVTEIAQRIPQIFRANAVIAPDRMVMFPWKAIHNLIVQTRDGATSIGLTPSGVEALSLKVRARKLHRPTKAAPAISRATPPPAGGSPPLEAAPAPESAPAIAEKLTLCAPALLPEPAAAAALEKRAPTLATIPTPAIAPFQDQEHERQLTAMRTERDAAVAALATLRAEVVAQHLKAAADQDALSAIGEKLTGRETQLTESAQVAEGLKAERDAALAHAASVAQTGSANSDRTADLIAERDAAQARAAKALAESEAAMTLAAEQSAECGAALVRVKELSTERDLAVARAADLSIEGDRANSHAAVLGGEMAAAVSHAAECAGERDATIARNAELAKERDAALARIAALEAALPKDQPTPAAQALTSPEPPASTDVEGCRNTMQALYAERDALRQEQQRLTARLAVADGIVDKDAVDAAAANRSSADAYGGLFPNRTATSPLVIVLLMVLLAYGVFSVSKADLSRTAGLIAPAATAAPADAPTPVAQKTLTAPLAQQNPEPATPLEEVTVVPPESAAGETAAAPSDSSAQPENSLAD